MAWLIYLAFLLASCPVAFFWASCPCCGLICPVCTTRATQWQAVVTGIANGSCTSCAEYDGTYICSLVPVLDPTECLASVAINVATPCHGTPDLAAMQVRPILNGAQTRIRGIMQIGGAGNIAQWATDIGVSPQDCAAVSGLDLPFTNNFATYCTAAAATCVVTAIP